MTRKPILIRHLIFWLIFISYELTFIHFTVGAMGRLTNFLVFYPLNIVLFYLNAHLILDFAFFRTSKPYLISITLTFIELTAYLIIKFSLDCLIASPEHPIVKHIKLTEVYAVTNIWRGFYFIGLSIAYWSMLYMIRFRERNHQMETEQLKSIAKTLELENKFISVENAYLQNQISPHLLFNSLNFIYNEVYKESADAGNSVSRLADLMRYSLVSADDNRTVLLSQEVGQIENLVELCRMRFREHFHLRFRKKGKLSTVQILPLILITLVENMMKHGDLGDKKYPAGILLELKENHLHFETRNKKRNTNLYPNTGLGLKNIEKRLSNYYHQNYRLLTTNETDFFIVNLTIEL
ncbi:MAG: histidine kinase [Mucilaginibacter sp.]|jgi:sensor histidine kinase YesM|uniref:sensor histidine kinase n=1 Tax=Mucilaginibacter sp. TaxID=1882438 RepID=UPI00356B5137